MGFLGVKGIYKSFGNTEVLRGVDFELEKGEVLSIIGSSGSGKTTIGKMITGIHKPDKGEIYYKNNLLRKLDLINFYEVTNVHAVVSHRISRIFTSIFIFFHSFIFKVFFKIIHKVVVLLENK